jgi:hypothetical protein
MCCLWAEILTVKSFKRENSLILAKIIKITAGYAQDDRFNMKKACF